MPYTPPQVTIKSSGPIETTTKDDGEARGHFETTAIVKVTFGVKGPHPEKPTGYVTLRGERGDYVYSQNHANGQPIYEWRRSKTGSSFYVERIKFNDPKADLKEAALGKLVTLGWDAGRLILPLTKTGEIDLANNNTTFMRNGTAGPPIKPGRGQTTRSVLSDLIGTAWVEARKCNHDLQLEREGSVNEEKKMKQDAADAGKGLTSIKLQETSRTGTLLASQNKEGGITPAATGTMLLSDKLPPTRSS